MNPIGISTTGRSKRGTHQRGGQVVSYLISMSAFILSWEIANGRLKKHAKNEGKVVRFMPDLKVDETKE